MQTREFSRATYFNLAGSTSFPSRHVHSRYKIPLTILFPYFIHCFTGIYYLNSLCSLESLVCNSFVRSDCETLGDILSTRLQLARTRFHPGQTRLPHRCRFLDIFNLQRPPNLLPRFFQNLAFRFIDAIFASRK